jgi:hypothetical protein
MYSFARRADTLVMDEHLQHTGADHPGREEIIDTMEKDPENIFGQIAIHAQKRAIVFIKNMGHHLQGFDCSPIIHYQNVLLIRNPGEMLVSYARVREFPTLDDIGLKFQAHIFEWLQKAGTMPLVLDGNEIRKNPSGVLRQLCIKLGIPYTDDMLHWPASPIPEDGIWAKYWYANVHQSTGFLAPEKVTSQVPESLRPVYEEALPYYTFLQQYSLKAY